MPILSAEQLNHNLLGLIDSDKLYDVAKLGFIQALLVRSEQVEGRVKRLLLNKAQASLAEIAEVTVDISEPNQHGENSAFAKQQLQSLNQQLYEYQRSREEKSSKASFSSSFFEHENSIVNDLTHQVTLNTANEPAASSKVSGEMHVVRLFRESLGQITMDKRVSKAIEQGPENPGPFNPQGLTIRALTQMRDLSPSYLQRFVGSVDTLLWLEQLESAPIGKKNKKKKTK